MCYVTRKFMVVALFVKKKTLRQCYHAILIIHSLHTNIRVFIQISDAASILKTMQFLIRNVITQFKSIF